jgi:hypothetical protein
MTATLSPAATHEMSLVRKLRSSAVLVSQLRQRNLDALTQLAINLPSQLALLLLDLQRLPLVDIFYCRVPPVRRIET